MKTTLKYILFIGWITVINFVGNEVKGNNVALENEINQQIESSLNFSDNEIVIEGTVITPHRAFHQISIFTSCVVEVNTIFNGEIEEGVIEVFAEGGTIGYTTEIIHHGQVHFPPVGSTAIFRLKKIDNNEERKDLQSSTPLKLYYCVDIEYIPPGYNPRPKNVEKQIYQKLESEFGRKRQLVIAPATSNQIAMDYAEASYLRQRGAIYQLLPITETKKEDHIGFRLLLSSTSSIEYLHSGELIVHYNEEAFGSHIVSEGNLIYKIRRDTREDSYGHSNLVPEHFEVTVSDIHFNKFKIAWRNTSSPDGCMQLFPRKENIYLAELYFLPKAFNKSAKIRLKGYGERYDYQMDSIVPFDYVAASPQGCLYSNVEQLMPATITDIFPDKVFEPLDTVQLIGKHLKNSKVSIYGKPIRDGYVIHNSDTLIQMVIPLLLRKNANLSDELKMTSGKIALTKTCIDELEVKTFSKENIKIRMR